MTAKCNVPVTTRQKMDQNSNRTKQQRPLHSRQKIQGTRRSPRGTCHGFPHSTNEWSPKDLQNIEATYTILQYTVENCHQKHQGMLQMLQQQNITIQTI